VGGGTVVFTVVVATVLSGREGARFYREQAIGYALVLGGIPLLSGFAVFIPSVIWLPGPFWVFPVDVLIGVAVVFVGGHALALGFWITYEIAHPDVRLRNRKRRERARLLSASEPKLRDAELSAAEAYDAGWQRSDRERNHRLGSGPSL
jgi:protein-S-isoprenylcysteine O-methyltransferase Ste14